MLRITTWLAIVALAGCSKKTTKAHDAAPVTDAATDAPPVQQKLDEAARIKGDIHAPRPDEPSGKPPRDPAEADRKDRR